MIDSRHIGNMLDVFAPALCVLTLLLGLLFMGSDQDTDANLRRDQRIRDVMEGFPIQLGGENQWILVEDVPIPTAQTDMLDLNAFTSRLYQRLGTYPPVKATVFIANSNDARSMAGHHPPNCYPASGWRMNGSLAGVNNFRGVDGRVLPASIYHFELGSDTGRRVWVVNGFLVPGSAPVGTLEETRKQSSRAETSKMDQPTKTWGICLFLISRH